MKKVEKDLKKTLEFNKKNWNELGLLDYISTVIKSNLVIIELLKDIKKVFEE